MTATTLAARIRDYGNPSHMLQNARTGAYQFPIPAQFTNWMEEVRAWRHGVVLLNQSYHMTDLYMRGPMWCGSCRMLASTALPGSDATRPSSWSA